MAPVRSSAIPIPKGWSKHVKSGFVCAVSLAHRALTVAHSWCVNSSIARVRLVGEANRCKTEVALLCEEIRIKDARQSRVAPASRPHYPASERLAILALKAARGWNNAQTARAFLLTPATIASWLGRLDEEGEQALTQTPSAVNRFPDFVALVVQQLRCACPTMGRVRIAQTLARTGLHLAPSTVRRLLRRAVQGKPPSTEPAEHIRRQPHAQKKASTIAAAEEQRADPVRIVTAKYVHHVWHCDLTLVPTALGFWLPWFPRAMGQHWPFCYWILAVVDHYSRKALLLKTFLRQPSGLAVTRALDVAAAVVGRYPKHLVTDQGPQFRQEYRDWCAARTVQPRFGAIGQHGSIALCERFIRTLKQEGTRRVLVPLAPRSFQEELVVFAAWYADHRPHRALSGRTPNEVADGCSSARDGPRIETRPAMTQKAPGADRGSTVPIRLRLIVTPFEGRRHLPVVTLEHAA